MFQVVRLAGAIRERYGIDGLAAEAEIDRVLAGHGLRVWESLKLPTDIRGALDQLARFQEHVEVILGLNLKEAVAIADVLGLPAQADPEATVESDAAAAIDGWSVTYSLIDSRCWRPATTKSARPRRF